MAKGKMAAVFREFYTTVERWRLGDRNGIVLRLEEVSQCVRGLNLWRRLPASALRDSDNLLKEFFAESFDVGLSLYRGENFCDYADRILSRVVSRLRRQWRYEYRRESLAVAETTPSKGRSIPETVAGMELGEQIMLAFRKMPCSMRALAQSVLLGHKDIPEAAKALNITMDAAYCRLTRARAFLRRELHGIAQNLNLIVAQ